MDELMSMGIQKSRK